MKHNLKVVPVPEDPDHIYLFCDNHCDVGVQVEREVMFGLVTGQSEKISYANWGDWRDCGTPETFFSLTARPFGPTLYPRGVKIDESRIRNA